MADTDYALVVAIEKYKDAQSLQRLNGPIHDAEDFIGWLRSDTGGKVPEKNIVPYFLKSDDAASTPSDTEVWRKVDQITRLVPDGERVGRRIYIFLAGHGFGIDVDEVGLLTVDATSTALMHFAGAAAAKHYWKKALFDEVVLFMDCCRPWDIEAPVPVDPTRRRISPYAAQVKKFFAFASQFGLLAREREIRGRVNGVFSRALVDGLNGDAVNAAGSVTSSSLRAYLPGAMQRLLQSDGKQEPGYGPADELVFATGLAAKRATVKVTMSAPVLPLSVLSGLDRSPVSVSGLQSAGNTYTFKVPPFFTYILQAGQPGEAGFRETACKVETGNHDATL